MDSKTVPENFTIGMVISDMLPVVFFGATAFVIGLVLSSFWINLGAVITFLSGFLKVIWKLIVVVKKKNVWPLFMQMRIVMPIGFLIFLIGLVTSLMHLTVSSVITVLLGFPQLIFFILGIIGMSLMVVFAIKLDSSDAKSNWIEQTTNGLSQACFLIGMLIIYLG